MSTVNLITNTALGPIVQVNSVEPTAAKGDDCVFVTEATGFRLSTDGGATFSDGTPPSSAGGVFGAAKDSFGDQSAIWVPQTQRFIWTMLHTPAGTSRIKIRIAYTSSSDMRSSRGTVWRAYDIDPQQLGLNVSFDYPQLAIGEKFLYITAHIFTTITVNGVTTSSVIGAVIMRILLAELVVMDSHSIGMQSWVSNSTVNFGVAQRCGSRVYWGSHENSLNLFRLYFWDESSNSIQQQDVPIPTWTISKSNDGGITFTTQAAYQSLTPDGFDWLQNAWARITGTRVGPSDLVFGWTAGADAGRPHPYIYLVQLHQDRTSQEVTLTGLRHIRNANHAWAFPGLGSVPAAGTRAPLALSCAWGGGKLFFPTHVVGFVDMPLSGASNYNNVAVSTSSVGAARWGDFVTVGIDDVLDGVFVTSGYEVRKSIKFPSGTESLTHFVKFTSI